MADVYGTEAGADAYHDTRGNTVWGTATSERKNEALLLASEWIDYVYGPVFTSYKTGQRAQIREWPRVGCVDWYGYPIGPNEIPREVENATYEVALREIKQPGSLNTDVTMAKTYKSVAVQGAVSVTYAGANSPEDLQLSMPVVGRILQPILTGTDANVSSLSAPAHRG